MVIPLALASMAAVIAFAVFAVTCLLPSEVLASVRWRRRLRGEVFFFYSTRRGWKEVVENNVLYVLPADFIPIRCGGRVHPYTNHPARLLPLRLGIAGVQRPFLLLADPKHPMVVPLNEALRPAKGLVKSCRRSQETVAGLLDASVQQIRRRQAELAPAHRRRRDLRFRLCFFGCESSRRRLARGRNGARHPSPGKGARPGG